MSKEKNIKKEVTITKNDLPLSCPKNQIWDNHPKIYLEITEKKKISCPYCGTIYHLI